MTEIKSIHFGVSIQFNGTEALFIDKTRPQFANCKIYLANVEGHRTFIVVDGKGNHKAIAEGNVRQWEFESLNGIVGTESSAVNTLGNDLHNRGASPKARNTKIQGGAVQTTASLP
jgi:hypothetical protein